MICPAASEKEARHSHALDTEKRPAADFGQILCEPFKELCRGDGLEAAAVARSENVDDQRIF
jgi:hypothetical protein